MIPSEVVTAQYQITRGEGSEDSGDYDGNEELSKKEVYYYTAIGATSSTREADEMKAENVIDGNSTTR